MALGEIPVREPISQRSAHSRLSFSPLHDAVDNDRVEMARLLLAHGADAHIANYSGRTPAKLARSPAMKAFIQGMHLVWNPL